jgi:hypothetical protein
MESSESEIFDSDYASDSHSDSHYSHVGSIVSESIVEMQFSTIKRVAKATETSNSEAAIVLQRFRWDENRILDIYYDDIENFRVKLELLPPWVGKADETYNCLACFEDYTGPNAVYACACGHAMCRECWSRYLESQRGIGYAIMCPFPNCCYLVLSSIIDRCGGEETVRAYYRSMLHTFVSLKYGLVWCPGPDCMSAITLNSTGGELSETSCECGLVVCTNCGLESHLPATCADIKLWMEREREDASSELWKLHMTVRCPKCRTNIEKSGGCHHMTCRCGHEFCWTCLKPYEDCLNSSESCTPKINDAIWRNLPTQQSNSSKRMLVFYTHHRNRSDWLDLRKKLFENISFMGSNWQETVTELLRCVRILQNTLIYIYGLVDSLHQDVKEEINLTLFQYRSLEQSVEKLDGLLKAALDAGYSDADGMEVSSLVDRAFEFGRVIRLQANSIVELGRKREYAANSKIVDEVLHSSKKIKL